jgi:hypothetical protein
MGLNWDFLPLDVEVSFAPKVRHLPLASRCLIGSCRGRTSGLFSITDGLASKLIAHQLAPGKAAVIAGVDEDWVKPLNARMEAVGGSVVRE